MENTELIILILILVALILILRLIRIRYIPANVNPPIYDRKISNENGSMNGSINNSMNGSMNGSMNDSINIKPDSYNQCTEVKGNCNDCINANINRAGKICKWDIQKGCNSFDGLRSCGPTKNIGGCKGTEFGCCDDGITSCSDYECSNCLLDSTPRLGSYNSEDLGNNIIKKIRRKGGQSI